MTATIPKTMRAIEIAQPGGPEVLVVREYPVPEPAAGEVLVRVRAAGVNRPDVLQRLGGYNPPPGASPLPGLEIAGEVVATGERVCALLTGGGYAEYAVVPREQMLPIPAGFSDVQAAAIPETFFTVWSNVVDRAKAKPGEVLLVHGGTSGIGTTAIQLGVALGLTVYATAGDDAKCRACEKLGATAAVNYKTHDFVAELRDATGGKGVDIVLDIVGGDYVARNLEVLRMDGRLVQIGMLGHNEATLPIGPIIRKRLWITGSMLRPRPPAEKGAIAAELHARVWPWFESGRIAPVIDRTFPLADAAGAHRLMESGAFVGKIVLEV
jgi:putative PIG3 family NAD(P)H quinone oxidoreductase